MKTFRLGCLILLVGCGGAEFTTPDDAGQGGSSTSTSTSTTTSMSTSTATGQGGGTTVTTVTTGAGGGTTVTTGQGGGTTVTTGSGGARRDGGPGGSGGQTVDASADAPSCNPSAPTTPVSFHLNADPSVGLGYCINNCAGIWVSILPMGSTTPLNVTNACTTTCTQCQPIACDLSCIPPQRLKPEGETYVWDGRLWEPGRCGPQMYSCVNATCVPPGKYVARMCANRATAVADAGNGGTFCMSEPTPTCVDVPFDYPATGPVVGVLH